MRSLKLNTQLFFYFLSFTLCLNLKAQDKTISGADKSAKEVPIAKNKIMLIPFENRMYMSEIDMAINKETKLNAKQIKATMRDALNEQLYKKLKAKMQVVDLLEDTVKTKKDLAGIYKHLSYEFAKVPSQENYVAPKKEKDEKKIQKGQLAIETNSDERFMNAKVKDASLVPYLYGKYNTNLFLFINELDIKLMPATPGDFSNVSSRKISVHYTVYTYNAKEINSGLAEVMLPTNVNNPSKISNTYFSQIADLLVARIQKALIVK